MVAKWKSIIIFMLCISDIFTYFFQISPQDAVHRYTYYIHCKKYCKLELLILHMEHMILVFLSPARPCLSVAPLMIGIINIAGH